MRNWAIYLIFALLLPLASCANTSKSNVVAVNGGIGGTGITSWEGGIGGTGVVGTITGFGSIIINGLHIHYEPNQPVESVNGTMAGANFAIGQVIAAQTQLQNGKLIATRLISQIPLVGPVEDIDQTKGEITVLGEKVMIMNGAELGVAGVANINIGDVVAISGHRGADGVYASRIDLANVNAETGISGTITSMANGSVIIDGVRQVRVSLTEQTRMAVGDYVNVSGLAMASGNQLGAKTVRRFYGPMFDGSVSRMAVEGIFGKNSYGIPGVGQVAGAPSGRAVVFVSKDAQHGDIALDGLKQRPQESWRENLQLEQRGKDFINSRENIKNGKTPRSGSRFLGGGGGSGGSSGSGGSGGSGGGRGGGR